MTPACPAGSPGRDPGYAARVRYLVATLVTFAALGACAPRPLVVTWAATRPTITERVEIRSDGETHYRTTTPGRPDTDDLVTLSRDQLSELAELFRAKQACALPHDPSDTPAAGEAMITLELAFPDQQCKLTLTEAEWRNGPGHDLAETMSSIRPARPATPVRGKPRS